MQYKNTQKIIIDKRKLDILIRLGCSDEIIFQKIKTGKFTKTGDILVDETLESLVDIRGFKNWGGNHNPKGLNGCNKKKKGGQVDQHLGGQVDIGQVGGQLGGQVVDKDKDIDIEIDINNNLDVFNKEEKKENNIKEKKEEVFIPAEMKEAMDLWLAYRREIRKSYKPIGLRECIKNLQEMSSNNRVVAIAIVKQSIANGWTGLFPLKGSKVEKEETAPFASDDVIQKLKELEMKG